MTCFQIDYSKLLDVFFKAAMFILAIINLIYAVVIFKAKTKKDDADKERDRKISYLKTLILDHNLKHFYTFFDAIEIKLTPLKTSALNDEQKRVIHETLSEHFIELRRKFIDSLLAIDRDLYNSILLKTDELQTHLSMTMFDPGINLSHRPKFDEVITENLTTTKTEILKVIFAYRG